MKKPGPLSFRIGNKPSCAIASCTAVLVVYGWYSGALPVPWVIPILAVWFASKCFKAKREVQAYTRWQNQWNAIAGAPGSATTITRKRPWAITIWGCLLAGLLARPFPDTEVNGFLAAAFTLFSVFLVARFVHRRTYSYRESHAKEAKQLPFIARIALPVPSGASKASEAMAAVPEYCLALLRRQAAQPAKRPA